MVTNSYFLNFIIIIYDDDFFINYYYIVMYQYLLLVFHEGIHRYIKKKLFLKF